MLRKGALKVKYIEDMEDGRISFIVCEEKTNKKVIDADTFFNTRIEAEKCWLKLSEGIVQNVLKNGGHILNKTDSYIHFEMNDTTDKTEIALCLGVAYDKASDTYGVAVYADTTLIVWPLYWSADLDEACEYYRKNIDKYKKEIEKAGYGDVTLEAPETLADDFRKAMPPKVMEEKQIDPSLN
jgi:hypothetical protein